MLHALVWILVAALLALWSLGAWVSHELVVWAAAQAGTVSVAALGGLTVPAWLAPWVPMEWIQLIQSFITTAAPTLDAWLAHAPSAVGWLTAGVWLVWGVGTLALLLLGAGMSALVGLIRRGTSSALHTPPQAPA